MCMLILCTEIQESTPNKKSKGPQKKGMYLRIYIRIL